MKITKIKLPKKQLKTPYRYMGSSRKSFAETTTSQGDPTNSCTTIFTTTHFAN